MKTGSYVQTSYLEEVYDPKRFKPMVNRVIRRLRQVGQFDAIAFRGSSGAAVAYPVAFRLGCGLLHVRKDMGHTGERVEGVLPIKKYVIIDDFIDTGSTIKEIVEEIDAAHRMWTRRMCPKRPYAAKAIAILLYSSDEGHKYETKNITRKFTKELTPIFGCRTWRVPVYDCSTYER
ncbi:MAG: phosphoribosyltransferase [Candidatus Kaiserbacteria bacterium]|nr:phosphoribosyltransferase [Candidatus Kaiserbacteria bacterium]MCR4330431.1 phosphoribosyltransferase [Patescibacteria group bacterium]